MFTASLDILSNLPWQASGMLFVGCSSASCLALPA
jgi:hypothetical protein